MYETLLFTQSGAIATITFNRPRNMNCFNKTMGDELEFLTEQIKADQSIKVVLLNGEGPLFMAGGDIQFFHGMLDTMPKGVMKIVRTLNATILNIMKMPKLVIASVHGSVAGVGMSFMMACDLVIAAEKTKFTMAYSGIGISPDGGATFNMPRIVGTKKAMEWLLLPDIFDAQTAHSHGLINWVVPEEKLTEQTEQLLQKLANGPIQSYAHIKRLVNQTWENSLATQLEKEGRSFEVCSSTQDFRTGITSFLQKKTPQFIGQ